MRVLISGEAMKDKLIKTIGGLLLFAFLIGCAATVYAPGPPPPRKAEVKPVPPGPKAIWVAGHWKWTGHEWAWVRGHWVKAPRGKWVPGRWEKRPRGHVWIPGHWKK